MSRILRPDAHIRSDARSLLDEAREEGLVTKGAARRTRILDDAYYDIDGDDAVADAARARTASRKPDEGG